MVGFDVFVSYSPADSAAVADFVALLERQGVFCWYAARDIRPGALWATEIEQKILESKAVVLYLTGHVSQKSEAIRREILLAQDARRPVIAFMAEDVAPPDGLRYLLSDANWIKADDGRLESHIGRLAAEVRALLGARPPSSNAFPERPSEPPRSPSPTRSPPPDVEARAPPAGPNSLRELARWRLAAAADGYAPFAVETFGAMPPPPRAAPSSAGAAAPGRPRSNGRGAGRGALVASAAVAVVGAAGAVTLLHTHQPDTSVAPMTSAGIPLNEAATSPSETAGPTLSASPYALHGRFPAAGHIYGDVPGASQMFIQAEKPILLEARDADGGVAFARRLARGEAYRVPARPGVTIKVDDPASAELFVNGVAIGSFDDPRTATALAKATNAPPVNGFGGLPLIGAMAAGAGEPADAAPQPVDVSAFAPEAVRVGDKALVQIYLHPFDRADDAFARARTADPDARARGSTTLDLDLRPGARVCLMLDAGQGLSVDEPQQFVVWNGRPCARHFVVTALTDAALAANVLVARVLADGVPIGRLAFTLRIVGREGDVADSPRLRGDKAKRYSQAFLSYSKFDRPEVLKSAQALRASGIGFFQDILSIEPGEQWRARLYAEIDRCDLFLLFWSSHSAKSQWVLREVEYAISRRDASLDQSPDITPIVLEGPPIPAPPPELSELHFNDMLRYVVAAAEMEAKAREAPSA